MSEEVYENLSAKEIVNTLKEKINSKQPFKVKFVSDLSLHIGISYSVKTKTFKLFVERIVTNDTVEKEETIINIPDDYIRGDCTMFMGTMDTWVTVSAFSRAVKVWREKIIPKMNYTTLAIFGE